VNIFLARIFPSRGFLCVTHNMPFTAKYPHLGATKLIRVPCLLESHLLHIVNEIERLSGEKDTDHALHIADKLVEQLQDV